MAKKATPNASKRDIQTIPASDFHLISRPHNRRHDLGDLHSLAFSIVTHGQIEAGVARNNSAGNPELIVGYRRLGALELIAEDPALFGLTEPLGFDVKMRAVAEDQAVRMNLAENLDRKNLTVVDKAHYAAHLVDGLGWTHAKTAEAMGYTPARIGQLIALLALPTEALNAIHAGEMTEAAGRELLGLEPGEVREMVAQVVAAGGEVSEAGAGDEGGEEKRAVTPAPTRGAATKAVVAKAKAAKRAKGTKVAHTFAELKAVLAEIDSDAANAVLYWVRGEMSDKEFKRALAD